MNPDFKPSAHEREKWNYIEIYVQDNINCEKAQYTAPIPVIDNWCGSPMKQCQSLCTDSPCVHTMFNTTQGFLVSTDYKTTNTKYKYINPNTHCRSTQCSTQHDAFLLLLHHELTLTTLTVTRLPSSAICIVCTKYHHSIFVGHTCGDILVLQHLNQVS